MSDPFVVQKSVDARLAEQGSDGMMWAISLNEPEKFYAHETAWSIVAVLFPEHKQDEAPEEERAVWIANELVRIEREKREQLERIKSEVISEEDTGERLIECGRFRPLIMVWSMFVEVAIAFRRGSQVHKTLAMVIRALRKKHGETPVDDIDDNLHAWSRIPDLDHVLDCYRKFILPEKCDFPISGGLDTASRQRLENLTAFIIALADKHWKNIPVRFPMSDLRYALEEPCVDADAQLSSLEWLGAPGIAKWMYESMHNNKTPTKSEARVSYLGPNAKDIGELFCPERWRRWEKVIQSWETYSDEDAARLREVQLSMEKAQKKAEEKKKEKEKEPTQENTQIEETTVEEENSETDFLSSEYARGVKTGKRKRPAEETFEDALLEGEFKKLKLVVNTKDLDENLREWFTQHIREKISETKPAKQAKPPRKRRARPSQIDK
ncbi:hypothetical protein OQA88_8731 [Cercophora sp. LCS_1]